MEEFIKNCEFVNGDYINVIEKYKNDKEALIFLDPPYFNSYNHFYDNPNCKSDNTETFTIIKDLLKTAKCKIICILNSNSLLEDYYKDYIKLIYKKVYQTTKKNTSHMILTNF